VKPDAEAFSTGAASGSAIAQPQAAARLAHPSFSWQGGERGYDRPLDKAFVTVERQVTVKVKTPAKKKKRKKRRRRHHTAPSFTGKVSAARTKTVWRVADSDLRLNILWSVDANGAYRTHWEVPLDAPAGRYRFVVHANRYGLTSSPFTVAPSQALTAVPVNADAGQVGVELRYPQPVAHEGVGDAPGDLEADLTFRPAVATSGSATFVVNGRNVTAKPRSNGVFEVPAPAGAQVEVKPGSVVDGHGNANGNALTLRP
jgi:hypothetical protein